MFGTVAAKSFDFAHFVGGAFHCVNADLRERAGHVADTEPNNFGVGIFFLVFGGAFADLREKIATGQFQIIFVDFRH